MGADAVIAGHPHVPQPWEVYNRKPIAYSLGNFFFDEECDKPLWNIGLMATLSLDEGEVCLHIHPLHFDTGTRFVDFIMIQK